MLYSPYLRRFTVDEAVVTESGSVSAVTWLDLPRETRAAEVGGVLVLFRRCSFLKYTSRVVSVIGPSGLNPCSLRRRRSSLSFIKTKLAIDPY